MSEKKGEIEKQIDNLKQAHEKIAEAYPNADNALLRNKVVESLREVEEWIKKAKESRPKCEDCIQMEWACSNSSDCPQNEWFKEWFGD